jgi:hypothetical protein
MLSINDAKYAGDYSICLTFSNGKTGVADLEATILNDKRQIFSKLKEKSNFKNFKIEHSTVVWVGELDLAPEYLFYIAFKEDSHFQDQFREWGYIT